MLLVIEWLEKSPLFITAANKLLVLGFPKISAGNRSGTVPADDDGPKSVPGIDTAS